MEKLFSTTELARMWNVSESTVKRWADAGDLHCVKTVGGHRRFRLDDISRFQRAHGFQAVGGLAAASEDEAAEGKVPEPEMPGARALERLDFPALADAYFDAAVNGQADLIGRLLRRAYLRGISPLDIEERIVAPALRRVGELWRLGKLTVADEHLATRTTIDVLARLQSDFVAAAPSGRLAVVGCPEGELHEVGARCAASLLELEGWSVVSLGANSPFFAFEDAVARHAPQLVCISSTIMLDLERQSRDYAAFAEAARGAGSRVVLGGEGFRDEAVRARFPHDFYASSFYDLVRFAAPPR